VHLSSGVVEDREAKLYRKNMMKEKDVVESVYLDQF
jgi:hypothetical protein